MGRMFTNKQTTLMQELFSLEEFQIIRQLEKVYRKQVYTLINLRSTTSFVELLLYYQIFLLFRKHQSSTSKHSYWLHIIVCGFTDVDNHETCKMLSHWFPCRNRNDGMHNIFGRLGTIIFTQYFQALTIFAHLKFKATATYIQKMVF